MTPYDSLREKLVLPFVLLGFIVSALLSLTTFALVATLEERAIRRMLDVELESFRHRESIKPGAIPVSSSLLQGYYLPEKTLPKLLAPPRGAEHLDIQTINDIEYSVLIAEVHGRPFSLLFDRSYVKTSLGKLALMLLVGSGLMTFLSFLVGLHLSGKVIRPITRLLGEVSEKAGQTDPRGALVGFSPAEYPNNEIGRLVREFDRFSLRLHGFLERESYFAADVSHELRTPVAVIRGTAEVLAEYPELPEAVRLRLQTIHRQAVRMTELLEAMLLLAREGRAGSEHVDPSCSIADVIRDAIADCQPSLAGRPIEINCHILSRPILGVERSLAYVVTSNLLRNACAHTHEGTISVQLDETQLVITDTGIGIPEDRFPSLFKRHSKGIESQGNGLGLSIVARVADMLGWQVSIDSQAGVGTRVCVSFGEAVPTMVKSPSSAYAD